MLVRAAEVTSGTEDAAADSAAAPATKVVPMPKKRKSVVYRMLGKVASIAIICSVCIFGVSMTSEANRNYFVRQVKLWMGDDTQIVSDNDERNERSNTDEHGAIQDIETELGIDVPEFLYRPKGFEFYNYEVDSYAKIARMEYQYNDYIIEFYIVKENEGSSSHLDSMLGKELNKVELECGGIDIVITEMQNEQDKFPTCLSKWKKDNVSYYMIGKIAFDECIKMMEEMQY